MNINFSTRLGLYGLLAVGCGVPATESDVKLAGVGLDPDEIGAAPTYSGGLIEYNLIDFAGAQLPLGLVGLVSYDQVGPDVTFKPPYKMVMGNGFIFQDDSLSPDSALGTLAKPPAALGTCQTRFEPRSYIGGLVDAGNKISFRTQNGQGGWDIGRRPYVWPTDVSDVNSYYMEIDSWRPNASMRKVRLNEDELNPTRMVSQVHTLANFPEGEKVDIDFPGGVPPLELNMGSIPLPLRAMGGNRSIVLPRSPLGVRIAWNGPRYDRNGLPIEAGHPEFATNMFEAEQTANESLSSDEWVRTESGFASCLQYLPHSTMPDDAEACLSLQEPPKTPAEFGALGLSFDQKNLNGQMYTGPWETANQEVVFEWVPTDDNSREMLTLTVRFLGPVDRDDDNMVEAVVSGTPVPSDFDESDDLPWAEAITSSWEAGIADGHIPEGTPLPVPDRGAMACDDDVSGNVDNAGKLVEWEFERQYAYEDETTVPSLQGDPSHNLAEVTCRLDDQAGRFVLSQDILDKAMDYAAMHGSEGAVFYLSRSTETEVQGPPVRDRYGKRHDTSPIKVVSRSMQIGRFWYGQ